MAKPPPADQRPQPVNQSPPTALLRASFDQRKMGLVDYGRIIEPKGGERVAALRAHLALGRLVVAGWTVSERFVSGDFDHDLPAPVSDGRLVGGHALVICGFIDDRYRIRNSWGEGWGDRGECWMSEHDVGQARDPWVVLRAPGYSDEVEGG